MSVLKILILEFICAIVEHDWVLLRTNTTSTKFCIRCGKQDKNYE